MGFQDSKPLILCAYYIDANGNNTQYYRLFKPSDIFEMFHFSIENYYGGLSFFLNIFALADTQGDVG